jgi:hypothetical protein
LDVELKIWANSGLAYRLARGWIFLKVSFRQKGGSRPCCKQRAFGGPRICGHRHPRRATERNHDAAGNYKNFSLGQKFGNVQAWSVIQVFFLKLPFWVSKASL